MKPEKEFVEDLLGHITYPDNWEFLKDTFKRALTSTESYEELFTDGELTDYIVDTYEVDDVFGLDKVEECFLHNFDVMDYVDFSCYTPTEIFSDEVMNEFVMENYYEDIKNIAYEDALEDIESFAGTDVLEEWAKENGWVKKDV